MPTKLIIEKRKEPTAAPIMLGCNLKPYKVTGCPGDSCVNVGDICMRVAHGTGGAMLFNITQGYVLNDNSHKIYGVPDETIDTIYFYQKIE